MKKTKLILAVLLVVCLVSALALVACNTTQYTVTWQNGKNYSFTDEDGEALTGEQKVDEGTELKFKVVPSNSLTTITKVIAGDETLTADNGVYSVTVKSDLKIAALATTLNNDVQSIAITTQPSKTEYNVGEAFNAEGMVVTATLRDNTTKPVTDYDVVYQTPEASAFAAGDTKVTISYTDSFNVTKTADVAVTVANVQLQSIEKSGDLTKTEYAEGTTLDNIDGLTVTAKYDDDSSRELTFAELTVVYETENATAFTLGDTKVTLKYGDKTLDLAITVRAWKAFDDESISVEMKMVEEKPVLEIKGNVIDATMAAFTFADNKGTAFTPVAATLEGKAFTIKVDLATALANAAEANWNDCKLYYAAEANSYIDLNKDSVVNYDAHLYYQGGDYHFQNWQGALKVELTKYEIRNVVAGIAQADTAINLTVNGELGTATELKLMIGEIEAADVTLDTTNYTFNVTLDLVAFVEAHRSEIQNNTAYEVKLGTNSIDALATDVEFKVGDLKYASANVGGKLAVKLVPDLATKAVIAMSENEPQLTLTGETTAAAVKVRLDKTEVDATVSAGKYTATLNLKDLLIIGNKYNLEIKEDEGEYAPLAIAEVENSGTAEYRLTATPRDDIYAKNLYGFADNDGKLAVSYTQKSYKTGDDTLVAHIMGIGYQDGKFIFVYENDKNVWGALKKGDWLWFADPVDYGTNAKLRVAPKDEDASKFKYGSWTIGYTTGELNDMDHDVFLAYDGTQTGFVAVDGILGFEVVGGHINVVKKVSDYTAEIYVIQYRNLSVEVVVEGQFIPALADTTGYGVHAWYDNAGRDFEGSIDENGSFRYSYDLTTPVVGTMYLHMMNAGDEVNLKATISEESISQTINGFTYALQSNESGEITLVITAVEAAA